MAGARGMAWLRGFLVQVGTIDGSADPGQTHTVTSETKYADGVTDGNVVKEAAVAAFLSGFHDDVMGAFETRKNPATGVEWLPRVIPAGHPLLVLTGRMKAAAVAATLMPTETPGGVRLDFSSPEYGFFHHYGSPKTNLPERRFFAVSPKTILQVGESVVSAMESVLFPN